MPEQTAKGYITEVRGEKYVARIEKNSVTIRCKDGMREGVSFVRGDLDCKAMEGSLLVNIISFPEESMLERAMRVGWLNVLKERERISARYERLEDGLYRLTGYPECTMYYREDGVTPSYIEVVRKHNVNGEDEKRVVSYQLPVVLDADRLMDQVVEDGNVEPILRLLNREVEQDFCNL